MSELDPKMKYMRINKVHIDFSRIVQNKFQLEIECKTNIQAPKDPQDKTALLVIDLLVYTPNSDYLKIELNGDIIFEFHEIPKDYEAAAKGECSVIAQEKLFDFLDETLERMGYAKLHLKAQKKSQI